MLVLLQVDAAALTVIERMLNEGRLPALAELRQRGLWQPLEPPSADLLNAIYPTVYCGQEMDEHGLYYPLVWAAAEQRLHFMDRFPRPKTVWERLGAVGRRSLVIDPYQLWRTPETPGFCISGWQFQHAIIPHWFAPRRARRALVRRFGRPPYLSDVSGPRTSSGLLRMREQLLSGPDRAASLILQLLGREHFDLVWVTFIGAHQGGHHLWDLSQVVDSEVGERDRRLLETALEDLYAAIDAAIGRIVAGLPDEADIIVFSPLGMGPNTTRSDLLPDMLSAVLAGGRADGKEAAAGSAIWRIRAAFPPGLRAAVSRVLPDSVVREFLGWLYLRRIDWTRTPAFVLPGDHYGMVRLNVIGRERKGIVEPAAVDSLADEIVKGLMTFCDPDGSASIAAIHRIHETMGGSRVEQLPDLVVQWSDRPSTKLSGVTSPSFGRIERRQVGTGRSGNHVPGIWILVAPGASRIRDLGRVPQIVDIAATACSLAGADMTGLAGEPLLETV